MQVSFNVLPATIVVTFALTLFLLFHILRCFNAFSLKLRFSGSYLNIIFVLIDCLCHFCEFQQWAHIKVTHGIESKSRWSPFSSSYSCWFRFLYLWRPSTECAHHFQPNSQQTTNQFAIKNVYIDSRSRQVHFCFAWRITMRRNTWNGAGNVFFFRGMKAKTSQNPVCVFGKQIISPFSVPLNFRPTFRI